MFFLPPVRGDVSRVRKVSPQPGGGRDVLGTDCLVGQQEQQAHPCSENPSVCSRTHGDALELTHLYVNTRSVSSCVGLTPLSVLLCRVQHPVYCVNVVGTQNANNLISISTDGKMCSWSLDMLSQPQVRSTCMEDEQGCRREYRLLGQSV